MPINFNVDPWYDDFDQTKNYHRILFKPGRAVQARELTQAQTILQDQITKFGDNIFKQNSPVTGGQITTNLNVYYIKLQDTYNGSTIDVTQFDGLIVKNNDGTVIAQVVAVAAATGGDSPTLVVSYKTGNHFQNSDVIYDTVSNLAAQAVTLDATGSASVVSISDGVFYVLGNFVQIEASTIILSKYDNTPSKRIGLTITETTYDYIDDSSLLDPAVGAANYQAPGADRYVISLTLDTRPLSFGDDQDFIELARIDSGVLAKMVDGSVYNVIDDYFAKRDYETNGDYVVNDFKLTPRTNANTALYTLSVGKGLAYVHGYRTEVTSNIDLTSNRARTTNSENNTPVYIDYGSYFYTDTLRATSSSFFDVTTAQTIDIHCVDTANIRTTNTATYNSTVVATGYLRNFVYDHNSSDADANTYVYKTYVNDLQNAVQSANALGGAASTITLPGYFSNSTDAYIGVNISITNGPSSGDFRTITAYNGTTHVATVNQPWTVTPTTASVFSLNFDTKDAENIVYADSSTHAIKSYAKISNYGKSGNLATGDAILENKDAPELLFRVGSPYVASISDASFTTQQLNRDKVFNYSGGTATTQLNYEGSYLDILNHFGTPSSTLSSDLAKQNFLVVVTAVGGGCVFNVGDIVSFANTTTRTITLDNDASIATLSVSDAGGSFTATILEKVYATNGTDTGYLLKYKNLITANTSAISYGSVVTGDSNVYVNDSPLTSTGQIYIQNAGLVSPGNKQTLYLSDVKRVVKIIDTKSSGTSPTTAMLTDASYDVTTNYSFDNGQRDSYYDHASITLKPGAPQPAGNLLVFVDYYQHAGGTGYFSLTSYDSSTLQESYTEISSYTAKNGTRYDLRDCLDFRPSRQNATTTFQYEYDDIGDKRYGVFIPSDNTQFVTDYTYYLGRKDKLVLTKDSKFSIIEGSPSLNPLFPAEPDGALVVAKLTHDPYTGYIPTEAPANKLANLSIEKVKHKRYTMQDIGGLESRINNIEYYTSLSLLEQKTTSLQISDGYGLNRFKNGILVDDFSSFAGTDTTNTDFNATINRRDRVLTSPQKVRNFPLKSTALINNNGNVDTSSLGYNVGTDGHTNIFTLPYTSANAFSQKFASRTVNINPYAVHRFDGVLTLTPNMDNWVDDMQDPALLLIDPSLKVFQASTSAGSKYMYTTDWKGIPGTEYTTSSVTTSGSTQTTTTSTWQKQTNTSYYGAYDNIGNTYNIDNGFIKDVSILPYIRAQQVVVRGKNMLYYTPVNTYFDGVNVDKYFRKANIINLTGVTGTGQFKEGDTIGYWSAGSFHPTAIVLGVYYSGTTARLYVAGEVPTNTSYDGGTGKIQNALFNTSGTYTSNTAYGTLATTQHFAGQVANVSSNLIKLSGTAPSTNNYFGTSSNTIYINSGTGVGTSATITAYYGANQTAQLSTTLSVANGSVYSIGSLTTDDHGTLYGIFNIPGGTFHNGERVFRIDNSNGNVDSETTYCKASFYAEGLQTQSQSLNFGADASGAKGVNNTTSSRTAVVAQTVTTVDISPPAGTGGGDPVAQTFKVEKSNYPNGLFLNSIDLYFATKPLTDTSPISLYVVGTLNGYPNEEILNNSIVTLTPQQVKTSSSPQYLDENAKTTFKFNAPIYIQPDVMYAFILKSNSKEYTAWTALNGDTAVSSSVKNLPSDATPSTVAKISGSPYIGTLFKSQNAISWTSNQNESLMFVANRAVFNTAATPALSFVVPKKLPQRTLVEQSVINYLNANNISSAIDSVSNTSILVDAFNITTTDFLPSTTGISYKYNSILSSGTQTSDTVINPGKFGTPTQDDIYLTDGKGQRKLDANLSGSVTLTATLSSLDNAVSPVISDSGLSVYSITWDINNAEMSNSMITLSSGGSGYNAANTTVTVSLPDTIDGVQATAAANISGGIVQSVWLTSNGSGYITTPTITITDSTVGTPGSGATVYVVGETSKNGGNINTKHITKTVTLDQGFDSGDLNVYLTAYRPINTDIHVYYKILNRNDTQTFEDGNWQLMTKTKNCDSKYSQSRTDVLEYTFAPGTDGVDQGYVTYTSTNGQIYTSFYQFAIKVVMTSSDHTFAPFVDDLRVIALPENVNTAF